MKDRFRSALFNLTLVTVAVVVTLGAFEFALRMALPQKLYRYPRGLFRNDPDLSFTFQPGFRGTLHTPEFTTHIRINSLGIRGSEVMEKAPDISRILVLGDSFVSALNVEEEDTFVRVMERELRALVPDRRIEVVNAGTPNYGTWHELGLFRRLIPSVRPDMAVLCVFTGNDLDDNLAPESAAVRGGFLVERVRRKGTLPYGVRSWLQRNSMAYVFLWNAWDRVKAVSGGRRQDPIAGIRVLLSSEDSPRVEKGYEVSGKILGELRGEAARRGIYLLVVIIPADYQVSPDRVMSTLRSSKTGTGDYDPDRPDDLWARLAQDLGLPVLDLLPTLRSHTQGPPLYMPLDGHLTPEGNRLAGRAVAVALLPFLREVRKERL